MGPVAFTGSTEVEGVVLGATKMGWVGVVEVGRDAGAGSAAFKAVGL
jgi:hypothetical protein